mmetsp:Transcript_20902/g.57965  ORF Transcript_20902/g.57965 Transcript_20902/m.57965 type:complete len:232 (-) Transcript_20902:73-768(-)
MVDPPAVNGIALFIFDLNISHNDPNADALAHINRSIVGLLAVKVRIGVAVFQHVSFIPEPHAFFVRQLVNPARLVEFRAFEYWVLVASTDVVGNVVLRAVDVIPLVPVFKAVAVAVAGLLVFDDEPVVIRLAALVEALIDVVALLGPARHIVAAGLKGFAIQHGDAVRIRSGGGVLRRRRRPSYEQKGHSQNEQRAKLGRRGRRHSFVPGMYLAGIGDFRDRFGCKMFWAV